MAFGKIIKKAALLGLGVSAAFGLAVSGILYMEEHLKAQEKHDDASLTGMSFPGACLQADLPVLTPEKGLAAIQGILEQDEGTLISNALEEKDKEREYLVVGCGGFM